MQWSGSLHRLRTLILAFALGAPCLSRAQYGGAFVIPVSPSILLGPLLLLLIPLGMELSKSDEARVRELESRGDWAGLAALASRRLSEHPDDIYWHELMGRTLQRQGRCGEAVKHLRLAFDARLVQTSPAGDAAFAAGLALGLCEMAIRDLPTAAQTMTRLRTVAPERWEPDYNLGVIHALQGDREAARAAAAVLATKRPEMAEALQSRYLDPASAPPQIESPPADGGTILAPPPSRTGAPAVPLDDLRLAIGSRALILPAGRWFLTGTEKKMIRAKRAHRESWTEIPVSTAHAFALAAGTRVSAVLVFSTNTRQAFGMSLWDDEPCMVRDAVFVERFRSSFYTPECLSLRLVDAATAMASASLRPALQAALAAGGTLPAAGYEVHYAHYGMDWMVSATWLLPTQRLAGDLAGDLDAIHWAHALANVLRPLGREPGAQEVTVPLPGPMP